MSLRLAPGDDPVAGRDALVAHLREAAPWGVRVEIEADEAGQGYLVDTTTDAFAACRDALAEAFEADVVEIGSGGSIPLVPMLAETFPGMAVLIIGARRRALELPLDRRERGPGRPRTARARGSAADPEPRRLSGGPGAPNRCC